MEIQNNKAICTMAEWVEQGKDVLKSNPRIDFVQITDKQPDDYESWEAVADSAIAAGYYKKYPDRVQHDIPEDIYNQIQFYDGQLSDGTKKDPPICACYDDTEQAMMALSDACLAWARIQ